MDVVVSQVSTIFIILFLTLIFGLLPVKIVHYLKRYDGSSSSVHFNTALCLINSFGGGVFLGTTMLHLIPESREAAEEAMELLGIDTHFPVSEFVVVLGFFLVMIIEHLVMALQHHHDHTHGAEITAGDNEKHDEHDHLISKNNSSKQYGGLAETSVPPTPVSKKEEETPIDCGHVSHSLTPDVTNDECQSHATPLREGGDGCVHYIHATHHEHHHRDAQQLKTGRSFVLLLAISLHTIFEGMALGLQDTQAKVWNLFIAVAIHKSIIAFSMGMQFMENMANVKTTVLFICIFSLMCPIGIAIGTSISAATGASLATVLAEFVLQSVASGTFLFVTFFEVLQKEVGQDHNLAKVFAIVLGFACITLLNMFTVHEH